MWGWGKGEGELDSTLAFHQPARKASGNLFRESNVGLSPGQEAPGLLGVVQACPASPRRPKPQFSSTTHLDQKKKKKSAQFQRFPLNLSLLCTYQGLPLSRGPTDLPSWLRVGVPPGRPLVPPASPSGPGLGPSPPPSKSAFTLSARVKSGHLPGQSLPAWPNFLQDLGGGGSW